MTRVRADPKGAMEADLILAVVGLIIIVMGGLVAVAGVHRKWSTDNAGNPVLGDIVAALGALVILLGAVLAIANVVISPPTRAAKRGTHHRAYRGRPMGDRMTLRTGLSLPLKPTI